MKDFAPAIYQNTILSILGETAQTIGEARTVFARYGLNVSPVRSGRASVPSVGFTTTARDEDGWTAEVVTPEQAAALAQYMSAADAASLAALAAARAAKAAPAADSIEAVASELRDGTTAVQFVGGATIELSLANGEYTASARYGDMPPHRRWDFANAAEVVAWAKREGMAAGWRLRTEEVI